MIGVESPHDTTVFARARDEPIFLGAFTDEEMAVVQPVVTGRGAPTPWLDSRPQEQWDTLFAAALRSLVARGMVRDNDESSQELALDPEFQVALDLRARGSDRLFAERQSGDVTFLGVVYPTGLPDVVLTEDITPSGLHTLSFMGVDELTTRLCDFADPCGARNLAGDRHGTVARYDESSLTREALGDLDAARYATVMGVLPADDAAELMPSFAVFAGDTDVAVGWRERGENPGMALTHANSTLLAATVSGLVATWMGE